MKKIKPVSLVREFGIVQNEAKIAKCCKSLEDKVTGGKIVQNHTVAISMFYFAPKVNCYPMI